jgi:methionyl-tRNA formyltransferase
MEIKIHKASLDSRKGKPGEVLEISKEGVVVAAGVEAVKLVEIQPPGKKKMSAYDFTLGHPEFKVGEMFS